jgi:hypothetical protein
MSEQTDEFDRDNGPRYAAELDKAAELLGNLHPIGRVGRLQVAAAIEDIWPHQNVRNQYVTRLEDALCLAICIIRHDAGLSEMLGKHEIGKSRRTWCEEMIEESGIDFDSVHDRRQ